MDTKHFSVAIKAAGESDGLAEGQFLGYASVFDNVDSYGDVVRKGAFAETIADWGAKGDSIPLLWGHDMQDPWSNIGSVEASEDDHGLLVKGTFDLENPKAQQVYRLVKGRRVGDMSFAYDVLDSAAGEIDGEKVTELRRLKLYEASIVPIGANQETEILAVKANADALSEGIKAGRVLAAKHIDSLRAAQEAIGVVIAAATESDTEKASGPAETKDEEPATPVKSEESRVNPSAKTLIAEFTLLGLV
jgi:HK97 family phage prohead protease